jgi:D-sedoheptulose 7-phosphate isomerase
MQTRIKEILAQSIRVKQQLLEDPSMLERISRVVDLCVEVFDADKKLLMCGNGGSAADAQHLAAEFSGRFYIDRPPLYSEALQVNTSYVTAVANDYGYDEVFARQVEAQGRKGDMLWGFSTSGNSANILKAFERAQQQGMITVAFTGQSGGKLAGMTDLLLAVPSTDTPRIQESHITIGHIICELVEKKFFLKQKR